MINRRANHTETIFKDCSSTVQPFIYYRSCHQIKNPNASVLEIYLFFRWIGFFQLKFIHGSRKNDTGISSRLKTERRTFVNLATETRYSNGITYQKGCSRLSATVANVFNSLLGSFFVHLFTYLYHSDFLFAFQDFHVRIFSYFFFFLFSLCLFLFFFSVTLLLVLLLSIALSN